MGDPVDGRQEMGVQGRGAGSQALGTQLDPDWTDSNAHAGAVP